MVDYAHAHGVVVEGELGKLAGIEDDVNVSEEDAQFTDPAEVEEFVTRTGVDSLAIAIGTSHGAYQVQARPEAPACASTSWRRSADRLPGFPIVLHGASSVPQEFVTDRSTSTAARCPTPSASRRTCCARPPRMAVCKINIDSDLRLAMTAAIRKHLAENPSHFDPRQYLSRRPGPHQGAWCAHKIVDVLGCAGKA